MNQIQWCYLRQNQQRILDYEGTEASPSLSSYHCQNEKFTEAEIPEAELQGSACERQNLL